MIALFRLWTRACSYPSVIPLIKRQSTARGCYEL
jgi:hypothetical protein